MITTARLELRRWRDDDRAPFAAINADPVVMEHFPHPLDRTASDATIDRLEAHFAAHSFGLWATARRDTGELIGFVGLSRPGFDAPFTPCVEIGWRLARAAWGHGFATEAALAARDYAFSALALAELVSFTVPANTRSRRVMERIGMTRDPLGDFDHPWIAEGHPLRRHVLYRLRASALRRD